MFLQYRYRKIYFSFKKSHMYVSSAHLDRALVNEAYIKKRYKNDESIVNSLVSWLVLDWLEWWYRYFFNTEVFLIWRNCKKYFSLIYFDGIVSRNVVLHKVLDVFPSLLLTIILFRMHCFYKNIYTYQLIQFL